MSGRHPGHGEREGRSSWRARPETRSATLVLVRVGALAAAAVLRVGGDLSGRPATARTGTDSE